MNESAVQSVVEVVDVANVLDTSASVSESVVIVDHVIGDVIGQCKWFSDKLGYGFITVHSGSEKGKDIFVHHTGVRPLNSNYKTLKKGEYINFNIIIGDNGLHAVNVTGIGGGSLMCDIIPAKLNTSGQPQMLQQQQQQQNVDPGFTQVQYRRNVVHKKRLPYGNEYPVQSYTVYPPNQHQHMQPPPPPSYPGRISYASVAS